MNFHRDGILLEDFINCVSSKTFQAASFLSCALIPADLIILLHLVVFLSSLMSINYEFII